MNAASMGATGMEQRLAAVLVADVEGYSRRMSEDAAATVAALDAARAIFQREVAARAGRVVDMAGDSVLAVFHLASAALEAAQAVQQALAAAAATAGASRGPALRFRIGIHVGELFEKADGSVYGDGVNIAARLQSQAPAGGVCISEAVHDTVASRMALGGVPVGALPQKNIRRPVAAWFVWAAGDAAAEAIARQAASRQMASRRRRQALGWGIGAFGLALVAVVVWALRADGLAGGLAWPWRGMPASSSSIAVLPFANLGGDTDAANFADGMHEDLLTQLASMGELKVISRTSVMDYRATRKNLRQIGQELGAGLLVEGSVRRAGSMVRVTAQLIDARTDQHLWAGRFDRELRDLFAIQAELATEIAKALRVKLTPADQARIATRPTSDLKAYELYLQAQAMYDRTQGTARALSEVEPRIAVLGEAVKRDPRFALAWAALAVEHGRLYVTGADKTAPRQALAREAISRALALQPDDPSVKIAEGHVWRSAFADHERAAQAFEQVLARTPYHVDALSGLATVMDGQDRASENAALLERALAVEPHNFRVLRQLMRHHRDYRRYDRALELHQQLLNLRPDDLALQAEFQRMAYYRTGTWSAYDAWRARQAPGIEKRVGLLLIMDLNRATARRDWSEVLRLLQIDAEDSRPSLTDNQALLLRLVAQALVHQAQGKAAMAREHAQRAIEVLDREIVKVPRDAANWSLRSWMVAVLGDPARAHADFARSVEVERQERGSTAEAYARRNILALHALLGELDQAQAEAERQVKLPGTHVHEWLVSFELARLWDTPAFKALVRDPASNAALPVTAGR